MSYIGEIHIGKKKKETYIWHSQEKLNFISTLLQIVKEYGDAGIYVYLAGCSGKYTSRMRRNITILIFFSLFFSNCIGEYFSLILVFSENENYSSENHPKASFEISPF